MKVFCQPRRKKSCSCSAAGVTLCCAHPITHVGTRPLHAHGRGSVDRHQNTTTDLVSGVTITSCTQALKGRASPYSSPRQTSDGFIVQGSQVSGVTASSCPSLAQNPSLQRGCMCCRCLFCTFGPLCCTPGVHPIGAAHSPGGHWWFPEQT